MWHIFSGVMVRSMCESVGRKISWRKYNPLCISCIRISDTMWYIKCNLVPEFKLWRYSKMHQLITFFPHLANGTLLSWISANEIKIFHVLILGERDQHGCVRRNRYFFGLVDCIHACVCMWFLIALEIYIYATCYHFSSSVWSLDPPWTLLLTCCECKRMHGVWSFCLCLSSFLSCITPQLRTENIVLLWNSMRSYFRYICSYFRILI